MHYEARDRAAQGSREGGVVRVHRYRDPPQHNRCHRRRVRGGLRAGAGRGAAVRRRLRPWPEEDPNGLPATAS